MYVCVYLGEGREGQKSELNESENSGGFEFCWGGRRKRGNHFKSVQWNEVVWMAFSRERERKLMARNIALVTSTEELERKLQLKVSQWSSLQCVCVCVRPSYSLGPLFSLPARWVLTEVRPAVGAEEEASHRCHFFSPCLRGTCPQSWCLQDQEVVYTLQCFCEDPLPTWDVAR